MLLNNFITITIQQNKVLCDPKIRMDIKKKKPIKSESYWDRAQMAIIICLTYTSNWQKLCLENLVLNFKNLFFEFLR